MPQSTVASQPALQWVSTLTGRDWPALSHAWRISASPCVPMDSQSATSSSQIAAARVQAAAARAAGASGRRVRAMSSSAQRRLTAVGRVASSVRAAASRLASDGSCATASASPYAAVAPISGAPRTSIALMACAASSIDASRIVTNSCGRRVWSMIPTVPSAFGQMVRVCVPRTFMP